MAKEPKKRSSFERRIDFVRKLTKAMDIPMAALSVVFFGLVLAELIAPPDAPYLDEIGGLALVIWGVFVLEFVVKFFISPDRGRFLVRSWFDLLVLLVPMLRVLRALQALRALRGLQALGRGMLLVRLGVATRRGIRALTRFLERSQFAVVGAITLVVVLSASVAMYLIERDAPGSRILSFGDALWWAAAVVTTIASDLNPVTTGGRVLAVLLMVYGMVIFGYFVSQAVSFIQAPSDRR